MVAAVAVSALTVVQSRINGELGQDLNDGILAAWISFAIGLVAIAIVVVSMKRHRRAVAIHKDARPGIKNPDGFRRALKVALEHGVIVPRRRG